MAPDKRPNYDNLESFVKLRRCRAARIDLLRRSAHRSAAAIIAQAAERAQRVLITANRSVLVLQTDRCLKRCGTRHGVFPAYKLSRRRKLRNFG